MSARIIYLQILIFVLSFILVPGCGIYNTQTTDIPLISEKNDLRIDAGISIVPAAQATISYGLINKIAIQASGSIGIEDRYYFQIAPGLYNKFGTRNVIELYTGIGHGYGNTGSNSLSNSLPEYKSKLYGDYELYFAQLNFGRIASSPGQMDYGLGIKAGYFQTSLTDQNYYQFTSESGPFPHFKQNSILIEPVLFFRSGNENLKFSYKFGFTRIIKINKSDKEIPIAGGCMGFGINFNPDFKNRRHP